MLGHAKKTPPNARESKGVIVTEQELYRHNSAILHTELPSAISVDIDSVRSVVDRDLNLIQASTQSIKVQAETETLHKGHTTCSFLASVYPRIWYF